MSFTPEQRDAWRAEQKRKPTWRPTYGWQQVPVMRDTGLLDENDRPIKELIGFQRAWSHAPGAILTSAPKGTGQEGACFIVWEDRTLCKIKRNVYELLAKMPPDSRVAALKQTLSGGTASVTSKINEEQLVAADPRDNRPVAGHKASLLESSKDEVAPVAAQNNMDGDVSPVRGVVPASKLPRDANL